MARSSSKPSQCACVQLPATGKTARGGAGVFSHEYTYFKGDLSPLIWYE